MSKEIYLDAAAGLPMGEETCGIYRTLATNLTNPNNPYSKSGNKALSFLTKAKNIICELVGDHDHSGEVVFTGSGSHANYLVNKYLCSDKLFYISNVEHSSLSGDRYLCSYGNGYIGTPFGFKDNLSVNLSHMLVNNETGIYFGEAIERLPKVNFKHSDCSQALGKYRIDVDELKLDAVTLSSHKVGGPAGLGCLWIRSSEKAKLIPYLGTPNVAACFTFAKTAENESKTQNQYTSKSSLFISSLSDRLRNTNYEEFIIHHTTWNSGILSIRFPGFLDATMLCMEAADRGVVISTGAACNMENKTVPSKTLLEFGLTPEQALATIRVSFPRSIKNDDVIEASEIIGSIVAGD